MQQIIPRTYQTEAINAGLDFFSTEDLGNAIEIITTGAGKSVIIANIAKQLEGDTLILQPSKEILEQNYKKFCSYGFRAGIYSASAGSKFIDKTTFATIGSINKKTHLFRNVKNIIMDECDLCNPEGGMYDDFFKAVPAKVLGLTATPYRLTSTREGSMLDFITRTTPRVFSKIIYYIQNETLFNAGHLAKLEYFSFDVIDRSMIQMNANGSDFNEASLREYYRTIDLPKITIKYARKLLSQRKNLLVFCSLVSEANIVAAGIPGAVVLTGETETNIRSRIIKQFQNGIIPCIINVGVLTVGFDMPELEALLMARSTMSLRLWYQIVGRGMRIHPEKESCWIVDLGGNLNFFGKIETMKIEHNSKGLPYISNNGRQLTNVIFTKN